MRGGTPRGPFFIEDDLPADVVTRDRFLLAMMGSTRGSTVRDDGGALTRNVDAALAAASRLASNEENTIMTLNEPGIVRRNIERADPAAVEQLSRFGAATLRALRSDRRGERANDARFALAPLEVQR